MISYEFVEGLMSVDTANARREYNFLDVIHREDKEDIITEWLAFFFDPQRCGSDKPLRLFCESLGVEYLENTYVEVETQYVLDNNRRLDLWIKMDNAWIVIENKINSWENSDQTKAYKSAISKLAKEESIQDVKYVYLKPEYNPSKPTCKDFEIVTYGDLAEIWMEIWRMDFSLVDNGAEYYYFAELMKLIKGRYAMDQEIQFKDNTIIYLANINEFTAVKKSIEEDGKIVKNKLLSLLGEVFPSEEGWKVYIPTKQPSYIQFYKEKWSKNLHFEIGFTKKNRYEVYFNRLIAKEVYIDFRLHAEYGCKKPYGELVDKIVHENRYCFCEERYNFGDAENCIESLNDIAKRLQEIKETFTSDIDDLINNSAVNNQTAQ